MRSKIKWCNDKISQNQELEIAVLKIGDEARAMKEHETIEHYQELLKQQ